jgi:hypothetical protein
MHDHSLGPPRPCVFCGQRPVDKTVEHVLPYWLIELTGDPKRRARFGMDWSKTPPEHREFSFDQFTVPACRICNESFSALEGSTKAVIKKLLTDDALGIEDFSCLLQWLDKVRIGLWLANYMLDKNILGINPNHYIAERVGGTDRALILFKHDGRVPRLSFLGTDRPSFRLAPIAVGLVINNYLVISIAHLGLCARRLGFPHLTPLRIREDGRVESAIHAGLERIIHPIIPHFPHPYATGIYQPILKNVDSDELPTELFGTAHCRSNSLDAEHGIGSIFLQSNGRARRYSEQPSKDWVPRLVRFSGTASIANDFIHRQQLRFLEQGLPLWPPEERSVMSGIIKKIRR